jgi:hypothetical protein
MVNIFLLHSEISAFRPPTILLPNTLRTSKDVPGTHVNGHTAVTRWQETEQYGV